MQKSIFVTNVMTVSQDLRVTIGAEAAHAGGIMPLESPRQKYLKRCRFQTVLLRWSLTTIGHL